ncbi:DUF1573 domain-containing protein [Haliscomenobacter sp.]|uniref:DUF1573 domain-containing protein n=1 Tax=Haliscomenobacter sp. TaxID=2717303 RepID=UPI003BA982C7
MKSYFSILLLLLFAGLSLQAQPLRKSSRQANLEAAEAAMTDKNYYQAVTLLEKAYEEVEDESLLPQLAEMNYQLRDYTKAARYYRALLRKDKQNNFVELRYKFGRSLKMNGDCEEALEEFQKFIGATKDEKLKELAQYEVTGCEMAMSKTKAKVTPKALDKNVSNAFSEYSPSLYRDGSLYYVSFETDEVVIASDSAEEKGAKIYKTTRTDKGWGKPEVLDQKINREGYQTSFVSFSPDGSRMYFTRALMQGNEVSESKIFYSQGGGDSWGAAQECTGINGEYLSLHPVVGELFGKEVIFFTSNMDGGQGGLDLYYATYKGEGVYGDPINLGPKINTPGDEVTPFYFDGTLYFSSNGHPGYGGQDIFFTVWNGQVWSEPRNLGNGYNSSTDDQYFSLDREGYKGFFTSNRPGTNRSVRAKTCCDDIYEFEVPRIKADLVVGVFDIAKKPLKGGTTNLGMVATTEITPVDQKLNADGNRFDFPLTLDKAYKIKVTVPGYFPDSAQVSTIGLKESKVLEKRFFLKARPETKVKEEPEYDTVTTEQPILLDNIVYGYDDDKITPESEPDLNLVLELMKKYPDMVIELSSHTDYRGRDTYNQDLSQRRAESARKWLLAKGISSTRIQAKGYGESQPKPVNEKMASEYLFMTVKDTLTQAFIDNLETKEQQEAAHQLNRRTEFKIIKGPTKIVIKRAELRKKPTTTKPAPNRNKLIDTVPAPAPVKDTIHRFSTLYYAKDLKGVPVMQFKIREVDFGKVKKGEKREYTFEFTNKGDAELKIAIITACDCTTTDYSTDPVKPGESGKIKVTFDSTDKTESETIDVDIILENTMPGKDSPIIERLQYKFELIK